MPAGEILAHLARQALRKLHERQLLPHKNFHSLQRMSGATPLWTRIPLMVAGDETRQLPVRSLTCHTYRLGRAHQELPRKSRSLCRGRESRQLRAGIHLQLKSITFPSSMCDIGTQVTIR